MLLKGLGTQLKIEVASSGKLLTRYLAFSCSRTSSQFKGNSLQLYEHRLSNAETTLFLKCGCMFGKGVLKEIALYSEFSNIFVV